MKALIATLVAATVGCAAVATASAAAAAAVTYNETVLWSFGSGTDGGTPYANLIEVNGTLYGTTAFGGGTGCHGYGCGTVFSLDPNTGAEKVLYPFCSKANCSDGSNPEAGLINVTDKLYGTTTGGGPNGGGTVFSIDPSTGAERVIYSFCTYPNCVDGSYPLGGLSAFRGKLYGTTGSGGTCDFCGTLFMLDPGIRAEKVLYSFCSQVNCSDGVFPMAGPVVLNGTLYGTTAGGGGPYNCHSYATGCGIAFSVDPGTGSEAVLYEFGNHRNGQSPVGSLVDMNGILYGTTTLGGKGEIMCNDAGCGTVFSLHPRTGGEKVLYSFCSQQNCTDGARPQAGLIPLNNVLYGTTYAGGGTGCSSIDGKGCGTVFALDPATGTEMVLYSFCSQQSCADGANPSASLIALNGNLYGTTQNGGAYGFGTVFVLSENRK